MFKAARLVPLLCIASALSGCVVAIGNDDGEDEQWQTVQRANDSYIDNLYLGTSNARVIADLGPPDFKEAFERHGDVFEVLYYRTHHRKSDGKTTKEETTPLVFVDGILVGYGESAIDKATAHFGRRY